MDLSDAELMKIPGWFTQPDIDLFRLILDTTREQGGDLAELGVYEGRCTVLLGAHLSSGETLSVVDTFGGKMSDAANQWETDEQYATFSRSQFERNYRAVHGDLPYIIEGLSSTIVEHARTGAHRLVHVDASHLYDHVAGDIEAARTLLKPDGVVVLDDYRSPHTPGVAAAAWWAVAEHGLRPFLLTEAKMYATWGDADRWRATVEKWVAEPGRSCESEVQQIGEHRIVRIAYAGTGLSKYVPPVLMPAAVRLLQRVRAVRSRG